MRCLQYGVEDRQYSVGDNNAIEPIEDAPNEGHVTYSGLLHNPVNSLPTLNEDLTDNIRSTIEGMVEAGVPDELGYLVNESRIRNQTQMDQVHTDFFNGIVSGRRPVSDVDEFREAIRSNGGQDAIDEYERLLDEGDQ